MSAVSAAMQRLLAFNERQLDRHRPKTDGPVEFSFPWTKRLEANWEVIAAEVDTLIARRINLPQVNDVVGSDQGNEGSWSNFVLFSYGTWLDMNVERCPRTAELVRDVAGLQVAGFTVLGPRSHLPRHRGPKRGTLRYQIGLRVPEPPGSCRIEVGSVMHTWFEGATLMFDDSVEHEAWNDSDAERFVLFVEVTWPFPGVTGLLNRLTQRAFSLAARSFPTRIVELDAILNPQPQSDDAS